MDKTDTSWDCRHYECKPNWKTHLGYRFDTIVYSDKEEIPCGFRYHYAIILDGTIVAIASENGTYSGGIDADTPESINNYVRMMETSSDPLWRSLYDNLRTHNIINI